MKKLDRYMFRELLAPTLLGLLLFTFVVMMHTLFDVAEIAVRHGASLEHVLQMLGLALPKILVLTIPLSLLFGNLVGVGRLSSNHEMVAMRACGISYFRLAVPSLALGLSFFAATEALYLYGVPWSETARHRLQRNVFIDSDMTREIKPRVFFESFPGVLLYADDRDPQSGELERVFLFEAVDKKVDRIYVGRRSELSYEPRSGTLSMRIEDGWIHNSDASDPAGYSSAEFGEWRFTRDSASLGERLEDDSDGLRKHIREKYPSELLDDLRTAREQNDDRGLYQTQLQLAKKVALPFTCVVFSIIGFPLGMSYTRGGKTPGFLISILLVVAYWVAGSTCEKLALEGKLQPYLAEWIPNIAFLAWGLWALARRSHGLHNPWSSRWRQLRGRLASWLPRRRGEKAEPRPARRAARRRYRGGFPLLIDRHVGRQFLYGWAVAALGIFVMYGLILFVGMFDHLLRNDVPMSRFLLYLQFRAPMLSGYIIPVAALVATVLTFGVMATFNELTAAKAAGISLYRLSLPVLAITVGLFALDLWIQNDVLPVANQKAEALEDSIRGRPPRSHYRPDRKWVFGEGFRLYHYRLYDPDATTFLGFSSYLLSPTDFMIQERLFARRAVWDGRSWVLHNGWYRYFTDEGEHYERFKKKRFQFPEQPEYFAKEHKLPAQMSYGELSAYIDDLQQSGYDVQPLLVAKHEKLAFPAITLVTVLLGMPFAFRVGRKGSLYGVGLSIVLVIVYIVTFATFTALGEQALLPPLLAAWAPNVVMGALGVYFMLTVRT